MTFQRLLQISRDRHRGAGVQGCHVRLDRDPDPYRYLDLEGTLIALCRLWEGAGEAEQRSILAAVERLAEHN